jgi:hypothetical protein
MASISRVQPRNLHPGGEAGLTGPLAFSLVGLLMHCLTLVIQGEPSLASLRFAQIIGAAPVATLSALRLLGNTDQLTG